MSEADRAKALSAGRRATMPKAWPRRPACSAPGHHRDAADAPALKVANTRASGAEVVLYDRVKDSREEIGHGIAAKTGATIVPPYDHPWILTGQGTAGLEIAEQAKQLGVTLDAVAAPCSGGGLATGVALGVKGISPTTSVHAGEPAGFDDLARSLAAGTKQKNEKLSGSICDALLRRRRATSPSRWRSSSSDRDWWSPTKRCWTRWNWPFASSSWWSSRAVPWRSRRRSPGSCRSETGPCRRLVQAAMSTMPPSSGRSTGRPDDLPGSGQAELADIPLAEPGSALISAYFGYAVNEGRFRAGVALSGIASSLAIATPILLFEIWGQRQGFVRHHLQRLPLVWFFLFRLSFYSVVIVGGLVFTRVAIAPQGLQFDATFRDSLVFAISMATIANLLFQIGLLLGFRTLSTLLIGRYAKPRAEQRVFLLIDMKNSTGLAERLGPIRFHELLNDFFRDIADAALECGAEIHKYVGDEAILTWPAERSLTGDCLACPFVAQRRIAGNAAQYRKRFGVVPEFRQPCTAERSSP